MKAERKNSEFELVGMNNAIHLQPKRENIMSRRAFLKSLTALVGGFALPVVVRAATPPVGKILQHSPLAGFQYHQGEALWPQLAVGQPLQLEREPDNRYDDRAVRVEWHGHKLGYVPRLDNATVSQLLDRGEKLEATIAWLNESHNPWERIGVEVKWAI